MSFSLYGALPPSKSDKAGADSTKKETSSNQLGGLYSSLPAPESGPTLFKSNPQASSSKPTSATTATHTTATTASTADAQPTKPAGWSAINTFRPVLRRPTIQAKPKLNKPFIPAGATIVSTKTITKEDREKELQMESQAKKASLDEQQKKNDTIDLGAIPLLTTADDVNGFRATQKTSKKKKKGGKAAAAIAPPPPVVFNMLEDYDPHRPNDYEQYKEERRELKEQQKRKREWEKRQDIERSRSRSPSRSRSDSRSRSNSRSRSRSASPYRHVATDPTPSSKINLNETAEDAYMRRLKMSQQQQQQPNPMPEPPRLEETHPTPHVVAPKTKEIPSQVILLTNMVGPGQVDDMLQEETAEECSKYGKVERCLIFEVPRGRIGDDRAVRIFVQFSSMDSARNAIQDLHGRFFGGRVVSATYFDMKRFERLDLAPSKEEFY
ncbi:conserved hypothetical protein [Mucor ambiguus]|uniref:RRM domain-containing protein n=1 Tax=Mucor ambiguus TaxID=91626 RepID=A0A0C9LWU2_9FUNG|nr:conserved hypothetical protein [Mucor ambiguus]